MRAICSSLAPAASWRSRLLRRSARGRPGSSPGQRGRVVPVALEQQGQRAHDGGLPDEQPRLVPEPERLGQHRVRAADHQHAGWAGRRSPGPPRLGRPVPAAPRAPRAALGADRSPGTGDPRRRLVRRRPRWPTRAASSRRPDVATAGRPCSARSGWSAASARCHPSSPHRRWRGGRRPHRGRAGWPPRRGTGSRRRGRATARDCAALRPPARRPGGPRARASAAR